LLPLADTTPEVLDEPAVGPGNSLSMQILVLGGTRFVGRAVVEEALSRGHDVSAVNRGVTGRLPEGVTALHADRTDRRALEQALHGGRWDVVVDTWAGAPSVVADAVAVLRGRAQQYAYVSSRSVYRWPPPPGHDESAPVVDADPRAGARDYAADKRGGELAVLEGWPDPLLLRAGLILGPYEDIGRLPWWLSRVARGGPVVAPGRPERGLQYVDVRDLAAFTLDRLPAGGVFDVVSEPGHCTTKELLEACVAATAGDARLVWVGEADLAAVGVQPWTQLPCWVPETGEMAGLMAGDTTRARAAGLRCRPVERTVADTWRWLQAEGGAPQRSDRPPVGLPPELEDAVLARFGRGHPD
jgi:nucleoside-diphosphate-sugar epimerase